MNTTASHRWYHWKFLLAVACMTVSACANVPQDQAVDDDPLEPMNRAIFQFNYTLDGVLLKPVTQMYRGVVPEKGQEMVSNFLDNLYTPVVFFNSVLQADPENSFHSLWSFIINSTFGVAGLFDAASEAGLKMRHADLGQTFAVYGSGPGVYVVLPIIGPSNTRDSLGRLGDALMNPFNHVDEGASIAMWTATAIDKRSENMTLIDDIYRTSLDPYTTFRSGYSQKRQSDIRRAKDARKQSQEKAGF
jgi:phospholipid-binding lipoprotein MlaA